MLRYEAMKTYGKAEIKLQELLTSGFVGKKSSLAERLSEYLCHYRCGGKGRNFSS
jgi:hypothetical protein